MGAEADPLARDVGDWIEKNLGRDYAWPGNYRELDQCVKNVLIRRNYRPSRPAPAGALEEIMGDFRNLRLTADQLLSRYCTIVYRRTGSYEETARKLGIDRRTAKAKIDPALLTRLESPEGRR
jgi:transcriptional regulator of acetoin/glycerol metabolism